MKKNIIEMKIEVFDPISMIANGWTIESLDGNKYHSGGYRMVSPEGDYTIDHVVRVGSGYRLQYNCTINKMPMWTNADLSESLKNFMIQLGNIEHKERSNSFDKKREKLLNRFTFKELEV